MGSAWKKCGRSIRTTPPRGPSPSTAATKRRSSSTKRPPATATSASTSRTAGNRIARLTLNGGVRVDFVRRFDDIYEVERMNSTNIGPRFGFAFLVTADARNVLRGFGGRVHEQVNGRDPITTFATTTNRFRRDIYDANGDGIFEQEIITPAATAHQPAGVRSRPAPALSRRVRARLRPAVPRPDQPRRVGVTALLHGRLRRSGHQRHLSVGPNQPFLGFGRVDPNQGKIMQQTNATWSKVVVTNVEAILAKNLSHNFQVMTSLTRQWQHLDGTWNPTDPARFIQPDAFANNRDLSRHLFGNGDDDSLDGGGNESGVAYRPVLGAHRRTSTSRRGSCGSRRATSSRPAATSVR